MKVFCVAWEYEGGGGFNWYFTEDAANNAYALEVANCKMPELKASGWTAARFTFETRETHPDKITQDIDHRLPELFDAAEVKYKATA
jgi:hypothetical protein